jgi:phage gpG-like protein
MLEFSLTFQGGGPLVEGVGELGERFRRGFSDAMEDAAAHMAQSLRQTLESGGDGEFDAIADSTRKQRKKNLDGTPPLIDTEELLDSLTADSEGENANAVVQTTGFSMVRGTNRPDARRHHEGMGEEPARPFMRFREEDPEAIVDGVGREMNRDLAEVARQYRWQQ